MVPSMRQFQNHFSLSCAINWKVHATLLQLIINTKKNKLFFITLFFYCLLSQKMLYRIYSWSCYGGGGKVHNVSCVRSIMVTRNERRGSRDHPYPRPPLYFALLGLSSHFLCSSLINMMNKMWGGKVTNVFLQYPNE